MRKVSWKATYEGEVGAHWGLWDKNGQPKPGPLPGEPVLARDEPWELPGGSGTPDLELTFIPGVGVDGYLSGRVWHVDPTLHTVAVYILVANVWWTKPMFDEPLTSIGCGGGWTADVVTHPNDLAATHVAAFLLPAGVEPARMEGDATFPADFLEAALFQVMAAK